MHLLKRVLAVGVVALGFGLWASSSQASQHIVGSGHDFTLSTPNGQLATGWNSGQICNPCHTPHNSITTYQGTAVAAPLWGHQLTASATATYKLFGVHGAVPAIGEIDTTSLLCLSCHDGVNALSSYQGSTGTAAAGGVEASLTMGGVLGHSDKAMGSGAFGTDLSTQHPIGAVATYTTSTTTTSWDTAQKSLRLATLANGTAVVGCNTCHNPHGTTNPTLLNLPIQGTFTTDDGRVVPGSGLCLNCHIK